MSIIKTFFRGFLFSLGMAAGLYVVSVAYAAYVSVSPMATVSGWTQLSSSEWNKVVSNVNLLDSQLSAATSGIATVSSQVGALNSQMGTVSSQISALGSLSSKSAVWSAEITDLSVGTADIAASAVTDAKIAVWIAPSKIAAGWAASGQVLKWNGSAWAPAADNAGWTLGQNGCQWVQTNTCGHSCWAGAYFQSLCPVGKYVAWLWLNTYGEYAPYNFKVYCCTP